MVVCNSSSSCCWDRILEDEGGSGGDVSAAITSVAASSFSFGIVGAVCNDDGLVSLTMVI